MTTKVQAEFLAAGIISDQTQVSAADADHLLIFDASDNSLKKALVSTITSSGASAADDITAGDAAVTISTSSGNITIDNGSSDDDIIFKGTDGGSDITALTLDMSDAGRAMFNGGIDIGGTAITRTGDLTLDVSGDILLDADGENIKFLDGGVERGQIDLGSANFTLRASTSDKDMIFRVNDGGTEIVALTLDASEAGTATFNHDIQLPDLGMLRMGAGGDLILLSDGTNGTINTNNGALTLDSGGNIDLDADSGVIKLKDGGTENSQIVLDSAGLVMTVVGSDKDFFISGSDGGSAITAVRVDMSDAGAIICNGNVTAFGNTSDIRLKENVEVIPDALDKVQQLKGITFNYKKDGKRSTGLIAQDLEKVLPEAIYETIDADINGDPEDKHLAIRYGNTVGLLVEAIKELSAKIEKLEGK